MKNQYFGDVNDFRKYGLLRALLAGFDGRLLVAWMLTADDSGSDGGMRAYLRDPLRWRRYDPALYDELSGLLGAATSPHVSLIENSALLARTDFHGARVPDGLRERHVWRKGLEQTIANSVADLVFFDPDNGIEVPSRPMGRKGSSKYVAWEEIQLSWNRGCSLLVYQHFPREPRAAFASRIVAELRRRTGAPFTTAFRTPHVLFVLAAQQNHEHALREAIDRHLQHWVGQITEWPSTSAGPPGMLDRAPTPEADSRQEHPGLVARSPPVGEVRHQRRQVDDPRALPLT